ncbi:MAG: S41 family peptidase [Prolixibacteraceae bacterium]
MKYRLTIGLIVILFLFFGCNNENKKIENMVTFAKVYGYVKYFHPSDEASQIDWNKFSIYGASQIDKCRTKEDVINTLNQLFEPLAPSIKFAKNSTAFDTALKEIIPENKAKYKLTYWQHLGVSIGMDNKNQPYESRRIKKGNEIEANQLFDYEPKFGESIIKEIGKGIYCRIPIVLYCNNQFTFPRANENKLKELNETLKNTYNIKVEDLYLKMGNIVNVYNVFQHFYPYFDVVNVNWEKELQKAIRKSYSDKTLSDHLVTLEQFTAPLKDGHITVWNNSFQNYYLPPVSWEWIENKLVITNVFDDKCAVKTGDIVTQINNRESADFFKVVYGRISAGTEGWLHYRANLKSLLGEKDSKIALTVNGKNTEMVRNMAALRQFEILNKEKVKYHKLDDRTWYLNLDVIEMDTISKLLPQLEQSEAIICDLRGYPKGNHGFINYLMSVDDTTKAWMQVPEIIYPDHERTIGYQNHNWIGFIQAEKPYLGDKKVVFIINGQAISYAESYMGYIEGYKLATIVGQPTAGTNGDVNQFSLPGGYKISWTGLKVLKHNGSQHHGIGILPDIYVEKTIQGVKEGRDELLEKAMEIAKK